MHFQGPTAMLTSPPRVDMYDESKLALGSPSTRSHDCKPARNTVFAIELTKSQPTFAVEDGRECLGSVTSSRLISAPERSALNEPSDKAKIRTQTHDWRKEPKIAYLSLIRDPSEGQRTVRCSSGSAWRGHYRYSLMALTSAIRTLQYISLVHSQTKPQLTLNCLGSIVRSH
jgi:hypothetical protein